MSLKEQTEITPEVRDIVLDRDSFDGCPCCIYCGRPFPSPPARDPLTGDYHRQNGGGAHLHHVIRRSQGGSGEEENLVTLCFNCHTKLHNGHSEIQEYCRQYLSNKYGG